MAGERCISIRLYGAETLVGWDGTEAGAVDALMDHVDAAAANISDGYWVTGGWRSRAGSPPTT